MPSIDIHFLQALQDEYSSYTTFIETGTAHGDTIFTMEPYFQTLYTIEIQKEFHTNTKNRYNGNKIHFLLGDSDDILQTLLPTISEKAIFFLDGHWSSGNSGKGKKDVPLLEELTHIHTLFQNSAILVIDDCRLFGKSPLTGCAEDWSAIHKNAILHILQSRIHLVYSMDSEYSKNDRLVIHINPK